MALGIFILTSFSSAASTESLCSNQARSLMKRSPLEQAFQLKGLLGCIVQTLTGTSRRSRTEAVCRTPPRTARPPSSLGSTRTLRPPHLRRCRGASGWFINTLQTLQKTDEKARKISKHRHCGRLKPLLLKDSSLTSKKDGTAALQRKTYHKVLKQHVAPTFQHLKQ